MKKHGVMIYQSPNPSNPTQLSFAGDFLRALATGADVVRVHLYWSDIQPSSSSDWVTTVMDELISLRNFAVSHGRARMKILPLIDGIPTWVPDRQPLAHYTNSDDGAEQFGIAMARILTYFGDACDFLEFSNEPNIAAHPDGSGASTGIPVQDYARMAAYASFWIDSCIDDPAKGLMIGALDMLTNHLSSSQMSSSPTGYIRNVISTHDFYLQSLTGDENLTRRLSKKLRISLHAYPYYGADTTPQAAIDRSRGFYDQIYDVVQWWQNFDQMEFLERNMWVTEIGVNRNAIGGNSQHVAWAQLLFDEMNSSTKWNLLEGVVLWPLRDLSSGAAQFQGMGLYDADSPWAARPVVAKLGSVWSNWN